MRGGRTYAVLRLSLSLSMSISVSLLLLLLLLNLRRQMHLLSLRQRRRDAQTRSSTGRSRCGGRGSGMRRMRSLSRRGGGDGVGDHGVLLSHELGAPRALRARVGELAGGGVGDGSGRGREVEGAVARMRTALRAGGPCSSSPAASAPRTDGEVTLPRRVRVSGRGMRRDPSHAPAHAPLLVVHVNSQTPQLPPSLRPARVVFVLRSSSLPLSSSHSAECAVPPIVRNDRSPPPSLRRRHEDARTASSSSARRSRA